MPFWSLIAESALHVKVDFLTLLKLSLNKAGEKKHSQSILPCPPPGQRPRMQSDDQIQSVHPGGEWRSATIGWCCRTVTRCTVQGSSDDRAVVKMNQE